VVKAVDYLMKAADKARSHYAYSEATRFCAEAIEILDRHGEATDEKAWALEARFRHRSSERSRKG
jgi:hypothetical protein